MVIAGYGAKASDLIPAYDDLSPEETLAQVIAHLPNAGQSVLDVGAGTGRIAGWLTHRGCRVTGVEPTASFRRYAQQSYPGIAWIDDTLPHLKSLRVRFDAILAIGVLHHLKPEDQQAAIVTLSQRLRPGGRLILSLRHGPSPASRPGFAVGAAQLTDTAQAQGLAIEQSQQAGSIQQDNRRAGVTWTWLVLRAPAFGVDEGCLSR